MNIDEIENDISGYINVFMVNTINYQRNIINDETDNEDEETVVENNDSDDENTIIENFDTNQLIQYEEDEITVSYDDDESDDDDETIQTQPIITSEMKNSYCRFYVQHVFCYLKSWNTPNFDDVCQNQYGGDFERCVIDYMMPFVFNNDSFNNWLFDFAYRFDDSLNYLIHYLHEMEREDLINMLHEAIPPNR